MNSMGLDFHSEKPKIDQSLCSKSASLIPPFVFPCLVLQTGATVRASWPATWWRSTCPLRPPTSSSCCADLRPWSSTPVCPIWTSWDTKQKTSFLTSVLVPCNGVFTNHRMNAADDKSADDSTLLLSLKILFNVSDTRTTTCHLNIQAKLSILITFYTRQQTSLKS